MCGAHVFLTQIYLALVDRSTLWKHGASVSGAQQGGLVGEGRLKVFSYTIDIQSSSAPEFVDVTDWVANIIEETAVEFGTAVVYSTHTTTSVCIN